MVKKLVLSNKSYLGSLHILNEDGSELTIELKEYLTVTSGTQLLTLGQHLDVQVLTSLQLKLQQISISDVVFSKQNGNNKRRSSAIAQH